MSALDPYADLIEKWARYWSGIYGVLIDPQLVRSIIQAESSGNTKAVRHEPSGVTSYGLMQILDVTARELGLVGPVEQLFNPDVGIRFGVQYLGKQIARYKGNVPAAVAAYNAGTAFAKKTPSGSFAFVNQGYVDKVLRGIAQTAKQPAVLAAAAGFFAAAVWRLTQKRRSA